MIKFTIEIHQGDSGVGVNAARTESGTVTDGERFIAQQFCRVIPSAMKPLIDAGGGAEVYDAPEVGMALLRSKGIEPEARE